MATILFILCLIWFFKLIFPPSASEKKYNEYKTKWEEAKNSNASQEVIDLLYQEMSLVMPKKEREKIESEKLRIERKKNQDLIYQAMKNQKCPITAEQFWELMISLFPDKTEPELIMLSIDERFKRIKTVDKKIYYYII